MSDSTPDGHGYDAVSIVHRLASGTDARQHVTPEQLVERFCDDRAAGLSAHGTHALAR
jgi:hypothetical protein